MRRGWRYTTPCPTRRRLETGSHGDREGAHVRPVHHACPLTITRYDRPTDARVLLAQLEHPRHQVLPEVANVRPLMELEDYIRGAPDGLFIIRWVATNSTSLRYNGFAA